MIGLMIIACEVGFWVFVLAGLFFRYVLRQRKLGAALLFCTPVADLVLIIATVIDLSDGGRADFFHGLAAIYIGVTIAFGRGMINWADERFAYRFAGGPKPARTPKFGAEHAKNERQGWLKHLLAWAIGISILTGMLVYVGDAEQTQALATIIKIWSTVLAVDFLVGYSYTIWPRENSSKKFI